MKLSDCTTINDLKKFSKNRFVYAVCTDGYIAVLDTKSAGNTYRMDLDKTCFYIESGAHVSRFYNVFTNKRDAKAFSKKIQIRNLKEERDKLTKQKSDIEERLSQIEEELKR